MSMHAVRFYTAQVLLGLEALHSNGYIYRCAAPAETLHDTARPPNSHVTPSVTSSRRTSSWMATAT